MNIYKKLKESNIDLTIDKDLFIFKFDGKDKKVNKEDLEKYLLTCLINYIKI